MRNGIEDGESAKYKKQGEEPDGERFDFDKHYRTLKAILEDDTLKVRWLVSGLLARGSVVILAGSPKTGKTTFMMHIILHIKGELPSLGKFAAVEEVAKGIAIGYFNEMGEIQLKDKIRDVKPGITDTEIADILESVAIWDKFPIFDEDGLKQFEALIVKHKFKIVRNRHGRSRKAKDARYRRIRRRCQTHYSNRRNRATHQVLHRGNDAEQ